MLSSILTQRFDTSDIAFAKVDEEIAILREGIRALHAYRNTYTPVYRLPPEVLTRIFSLTMQIPNRDWYYGAGMFNRGVAVTRTSQHWRNVALASSSLWSHISSSYPKPIMEEWLKRSKAAPLYVNVYCTSPRDAQLFLVPLHRVRELTLELTTNAWNTFSSNMSSAAPLLEFLSITLNTSPPPEGIAEPTFWGGFPRLRHLHLSGCSFDTESSLFTDLVSLELCNPPNKVPEQALLSTLRNLPRLTLLTLLDVLDPSNPPVSAEIGAVSLSALQSLSCQFNLTIPFQHPDQ
ncbi:hypothetical protein BDN72DRAFT_195770 [Pluteus cervinus]|uniref:Uncharacterized protein n=1 Tax=Pluteus cervinus TaxID=181527 RepID=A0ACD3AHW1_9AGAR|nr:hypothetical protein BDN72DRAFT_195770 [Pluteus cervinus]